MRYGDFAEKFLIALYYETENTGDRHYDVNQLIEAFNLECKDHWISRITDDWEHSYLKEVTKAVKSYNDWLFRISGQGAAYIEDKYTDQEIDEILGNKQSTTSIDIPASNRIVTIDHNQQSEFEEATNEIIEIVEEENSIDGDIDLRSRVIGQLKAGRELIRAGIFKAETLYLTLIVGLKMLVEKYKDHAIGAAASKVIDLIYEKIGEAF